MTDETTTDDSSTDTEIEYTKPTDENGDPALFYCGNCTTLTTETDIPAEEAEEGECRHFNWVRVDNRDTVCTFCYPKNHTVHESAYGLVCGSCEDNFHAVNLNALEDPRDDERTPREKAMEMQEDDDILAVVHRRENAHSIKNVAGKIIAVLATLYAVKRLATRRGDNEE